MTNKYTVIDTSDLDTRFEEFYRTGQRVEVTYDTEVGMTNTGDERRERFYVGKSTGWRPCYLKVKTTRSYGGEAIGGFERDHIISIRPLGKYRH